METHLYKLYWLTENIICTVLKWSKHRIRCTLASLWNKSSGVCALGSVNLIIVRFSRWRPLLYLKSSVENFLFFFGSNNKQWIIFSPNLWFFSDFFTLVFPWLRLFDNLAGFLGLIDLMWKMLPCRKLWICLVPVLQVTKKKQMQKNQQNPGSKLIRPS